MKIKKLIVLFVSYLIVFYCNICANNIYANKIKSNFEVDKYLDQMLPSQYGTISIKYYLNSSPYETKNNSQSKTTIFNQILTKYVKDIYNSEVYPNFISQNGVHFVEFLELSEELNLSINPLYTCIRLFYNKIKECELIDDTVLLQILTPLPKLVEKYFIEKQNEKISLKYLKKSIEKTILFKFTEHLNSFQTNTNEFITSLAKEISQITKNELNHLDNQKEQNYMKERFRNLLIRFIEITISKIIWDNKHYQNIWGSVLSIANNLIMLADHKILDHMDDLDDMLWSLTLRFNYYLTLVGSILPVDFYEEIENDLANGSAFFLELEEQDQGIKTKKETLLKALLSAKTKSLAFHETGLFSDQVI